MILVILFGPPGVGKGTQALMLANRLKLEIISVGDMLRNIAKKTFILYKTISKSIDNGQFISDKVVLALIQEKFFVSENKNGYILDGYPRNLQQAKMLQNTIVNFKKFSIFHVFLNLTNTNLIKRLSCRITCASCGELYNKNSYPTKKNGICDICGSYDLITREDDHYNSIMFRIERYDLLTFPLVQFYQKEKRFINIYADSSKYVIHEQIFHFVSN